MKIDLLTAQTKDTYTWINKMVDPIPVPAWETIPPGIESNIIWQVGHLTLSIYYHSMICISGHQLQILKSLPIKQYSEWYDTMHPKDSAGKVDGQELKEHLS